MLYKSSARSVEMLRLDGEDLDLPNRRSRVRRKGGPTDVFVWQTERKPVKTPEAPTSECTPARPAARHIVGRQPWMSLSRRGSGCFRLCTEICARTYSG
jgi:hypothetical protein